MKEAIYRRSPWWIQNLLASLEGARLTPVRYGSAFKKQMRALLVAEAMSHDELVHIQLKLLRESMCHARDSDFWRARFDHYSVDYKASDLLGELAKLPIISKDEVRANADSIKVKGKRSRVRTTSGSTGAGLIFPESLDTEARIWAFWWNYRQWHGVRRGARQATFAGRLILPQSPARSPYWRQNYFWRQLMFSGYHLNETTVAEYASRLNRFSPEMVHGYPSMLYLFVSLAKDSGLKVHLPELKLVTTGAENLSEMQRLAIAEFFGVPVVENYGQAEAVANFSECPHGHLHVDETFSYVEFVKDGGSAAANIVGSNFLNPSFPLFRYDTGDLVTLAEAACPCGRKGRVVMSVDGRSEDYLVLVDGTQLGRLDHLMKDITSVREAQFVQHIDGEAILKLVRTGDFNAAEETKIHNAIRKYTNNRLKVNLSFVSEVDRTEAGKVRFVVRAKKP